MVVRDVKEEEVVNRITKMAAKLFWWPELNFRDEGLCRCNKLGNMGDNKEKLTAKFAKMDQNFFNPVCLWHIQQTTIAYFVYWPAQSLTKINFCCSTRVFYSTIKAASICSGILLLSFLAFQLFGPPKCLRSSYQGSRDNRFQGPGGRRGVSGACWVKLEKMSTKWYQKVIWGRFGVILVNLERRITVC